MTYPDFVLGLLLATLYGASFHLWQGGGIGRLVLYLLAGWVGFAVGHAVGAFIQINVLTIGTLYFFTATLGSAIALFAARWLALSDALNKPKKPTPTTDK